MQQRRNPRALDLGQHTGLVLQTHLHAGGQRIARSGLDDDLIAVQEVDAQEGNDPLSLFKDAQHLVPAAEDSLFGFRQSRPGSQIGRDAIHRKNHQRSRMKREASPVPLR